MKKEDNDDDEHANVIRWTNSIYGYKILGSKSPWVQEPAKQTVILIAAH